MNVPHLGTALVKVMSPLFAIAMVICVYRVRKLSLADGLGLRRPPLLPTMFWMLLYLVVMLGSNYLMFWRGPWDFTPWRQDPWLIDILRVLAVCFLGPIAEELIFRGVLWGRLAQSRLGVIGATVISAVVWAVIHFNYSAGVIALFCLIGILLGMARNQTRSVIPPMLMHILWNLYAIW